MIRGVLVIVCVRRRNEMTDKNEQRVVLLPLSAPCSILLVGPSQSGKTMLTFRIIKEAKYMFTKPPVKVVYCYSVYQDLFAKMEKDINNIIFHEGLPTAEEVDHWSETREHMLLVLDDLLASAANNVDIMNLFTIKVHHQNISTCFLTQNLYHSPGKFMRTISLNATYIICLKNQRDQQQLAVLGKQILPGQLKYFLSSYEQAVKRKYGYILLDLSPHTEKQYLLRTNIFPGEDTIIFLPK